MTPYFPLLKLPSLVLDIIFKELNPEDLIDLSMMSSKLKRTLELHKLSVDLLYVNFGAFCTDVTVVSEEPKFHMTIESYYPMDPLEAKWKILRINGEDVMRLIRQCPERILMAKNKSSEAKEELLEKVVKHLLSFLKVKDFRLSCKREINFSKLFFWKITKNLKSLSVRPLDYRSIKMAPEDVKFILEEIKTPKLDLEVICNGAKYSNPLNYKDIRIGNSSWVDYQNISIDSEAVELHFLRGDTIKEADINKLIKNWVEGRNEKLKSIKFHWGLTDPTDQEWRLFKNIKMEKILEGFELEQRRFTQKELRRRIADGYHAMFSEYRVIRSKTDGFLGAVTQLEKRREIMFTAWNENVFRGGRNQ